MSVNIPGKEMLLGGQQRVLPPLNAAAVKQYREEIKQVMVGAVPDLELVAKLAHAALKRNYPELTLEQVEEMVDFGNVFDLWETLMNLSGLAVAAGNMARRVQAQMEAISSPA